MKEAILALEELWKIIEKLRGDGGCPWDRKQTPESVKSYIVEEAHEVEAAVRSGENEEIKEELGDLMFMLLFMINLFHEQKVFTLKDVCQNAARKMISRHPHVFGAIHVESPEEVKENWEKIKKEEQKSKNHGNSSIPKTLPSLMRTYRLLSRKLINTSFPEDLPGSLIEARKLIGHLEGKSQTLDLTATFGDLLILICHIGNLMGLKPEDVLQARLDYYEVLKQQV